MNQNPEVSRQRDANAARHAQAGIGLLLARLWAREVDTVLINDLNREPLRSSLCDLPDEINAGSDCWWPTTDDEVGINELAIDYCRIMIGPRGHAAPYQSVWQAGSYSGNSAVHMQRWFQQFPQMPVPVPDMPDHVANPIQLLAWLLMLNQHADATTGDVVAKFYRQHLAWARPMLRRAERLAKTKFYRIVFRLTNWWLDEVDDLRDLQQPDDVTASAIDANRDHRRSRVDRSEHPRNTISQA